MLPGQRKTEELKGPLNQPTPPYCYIRRTLDIESKILSVQPLTANNKAEKQARLRYRPTMSCP